MPEQRDTGSYCATKPLSGAFLVDPCPDCGHANVLHVGVDHCPVCELLDLNRQLAEIVKGGPSQALMRAGLAQMGPLPERFRR